MEKFQESRDDDNDQVFEVEEPESRWVSYHNNKQNLCSHGLNAEPVESTNMKINITPMTF